MQVPERVDRCDFDSGYPATSGTVRKLAELVRARHLHPRMRARCRWLFRGLPSMDYAGELRRVWDFLTANVAFRYMRDPLGAEHITDPVELDKEIDDGSAAEDCESIACYAATLLAACGFSSVFEIQGRNPNLPKDFKHCALVVKMPGTGELVSFDPVGFYFFGPSFDLGDSLHAPGEPIELWNLDGERQTMLGEYFSADTDSDDLWESALGDIGDAATDFEKAVPYVDAITGAVSQVASAFGPYGKIVGGALRAGDAIVDVAAQGTALTNPAAAAVAKQNALRFQATKLAPKTPPASTMSSGTKAALGIGAAALLARAIGLL
jgi:hypothetical protein